MCGESLSFNQALGRLDLSLGYVSYMRATLHALDLHGHRIQQPNFLVDSFMALFINADRYDIVSSVSLSARCPIS